MAAGRGRAQNKGENTKRVRRVTGEERNKTNKEVRRTEKKYNSESFWGKLKKRKERERKWEERTDVPTNRGVFTARADCTLVNNRTQPAERPSRTSRGSAQNMYTRVCIFSDSAAEGKGGENGKGTWSKFPERYGL